MELKSSGRWLATLAVTASLAIASSSATAGAIFITGHDPDFHSQPGLGLGGDLLATGLSFVTGGTYNDHNASTKFLWVESFISAPGGHVKGYNSLDDVGAIAGLDFDVVDGAGLASVNFANYTAIGVASSFGGTLTRAELDALIGRKSDIENFINGGGGLFASAECYPCGANLMGSATGLFGFLPVTVSSIGAAGPFNPTPYGLSLGLTFNDLNDPTHNSFGLIGGLNIVDTDAAGHATTLAGIVRIDNGGFTPVEAPEPASLGLMSAALAALGLNLRRRRGKALAS